MWLIVSPAFVVHKAVNGSSSAVRFLHEALLAQHQRSTALLPYLRDASRTIRYSPLPDGQFLAGLKLENPWSRYDYMSIGAHQHILFE